MLDEINAVIATIEGDEVTTENFASALEAAGYTIRHRGYAGGTKGRAFIDSWWIDPPSEKVDP